MMKYFLFIFFICCKQLQAQQVADILIVHGKIIDGTGNAWFYGDVAVKDGKIAAIGNLSSWSAANTIDAAGLFVTPGFIDVHTHIEGDEIKNPFATNFIMDGVTSVITGNCGLSYTDIAKYLSFIDSLHVAVNVATLI
ncbi:MAG TPA: amidohydrolase family protein, partial [Chitinophagaceae bacterium]|nr:amidohydrolase family protein [Chitinophagaceae bacterium]